MDVTYDYHHHHHVAPSSWISLTLSHHPSLSSIASGRSSGLHPVLIRAGLPAFARPYEGVHRSTSFMSLYLLLQQCPACLVHLILIVFMMGGKWLYSCCFLGCCFLRCCFLWCCFLDLFNITCSIKHVTKSLFLRIFRMALNFYEKKKKKFFSSFLLLVLIPLHFVWV